MSANIRGTEMLLLPSAARDENRAFNNISKVRQVPYLSQKVRHLPHSGPSPSHPQTVDLVVSAEMMLLTSCIEHCKIDSYPIGTLSRDHGCQGCPGASDGENLRIC